MELDIGSEMTVETISEKNSKFRLESHSINTVMDITNTELVQSAVDTEADNQKSMEIPPDVKEDRVQGLFAPFNHCMKPDLEYVRLELENSATDQEAATKIINDRYKWIMENAARRKEKEQKDKMKFNQISRNADHEKVMEFRLELEESTPDQESAANLINDHHKWIIEYAARQHEEEEQKNKMKFNQISHNVDHEKVMEIAQLSHYVDIENIKKTTQLLHNMHLTPSSLTKDQSKEFSDNLQEIHWHNGLNRFIKGNYVGMLNTVTERHGCRVEDALRQTRNEESDGEEASQNLGSAKCKKANHIVRDKNKLIGSSFEELLDISSESLYEI